MREVGVELLVLGVAGQIFEKFDIRLEFAVAAVVGFRAETKYRRIVVYLVARTRIRHIAVPAAGDGTSENKSSWSPMVTNGAALDESAAIANIDVANIFSFSFVVKFAFGGYCLVFPNF